MAQRHETITTRLQQGQAEGLRIRTKPASSVKEKKKV